MSVNLNDWAAKITKEEGKKVNLSIAQVKEVLKIVLRNLKEMPLKDIITLLSRIK
jgi:hypothetical protein